MVWDGWERDLMVAMGWRPTVEARALLRAWAACEGGNASFNPLNTTYHVAGATSYNSAGVQNYLDRTMGLAATMLTLRLPAYHELRLALAVGGLSPTERLRRGAAGITTWGTDVRCIRSRLSSE